ncbi:MAG: hypothetical protein H0X42_11135 [Solirubrobacterales bacterium]|nr:hypothetical protein [Solirubrobacterales bacterium]
MRSPKQLTAALTLLALLALVATGCGGGGSSESTATTEKKAETTPTLSKEQLITQGDAICAEVNVAVGSVSSSAADTQGQIEQVSDLYTGMVSRLQALGTPTEDASTYANFMAAAEELSKVEGEAKLAAEREDTTALGEAATKAAPALENFETTASVFGFEECSEGPHAVTAAPGVSSEGEVEEGGVEAEIEEVPEAEIEEEVVPEEEVAPETGGAGGEIEEAAPEEAPEEGGSSGGVGPG